MAPHVFTFPPSNLEVCHVSINCQLCKFIVKEGKVLSLVVIILLNWMCLGWSTLKTICILQPYLSSYLLRWKLVFLCNVIRISKQMVRLEKWHFFFKMLRILYLNHYICQVCQIKIHKFYDIIISERFDSSAKSTSLKRQQLCFFF